jgi:hypothetical protein
MQDSQAERPESTTNPNPVTPESASEIPIPKLTTHPITGEMVQEQRLKQLTDWALQPNIQMNESEKGQFGGLAEYVEAGAIAFNATNQMQNLLLVSVKRPIKVKRGISVNRQQNAQAAQAYIRGDIASSPCTSCRKGAGPFPTCVVAPDCLLGACASCHYGGEGARCSFRKSRKFP